MMACAGVSAIATMDLATSGSRCSPTSSPAPQPPSQRVVGAAFGLALRDAIAVLQQLRSVLLEEPLDRSRARFVWSDVDVADAPCHAFSSRVLSERSEEDHIC